MSIFAIFFSILYSCAKQGYFDRVLDFFLQIKLGTDFPCEIVTRVLLERRMKWVHDRHGPCVSVMSSFYSIFLRNFLVSVRHLNVGFNSI